VTPLTSAAAPDHEALAAQSLNKALPCSLPGGLLRCESDSVSGALLMIRKAVQDQPLAETGSR